MEFSLSGQTARLSDCCHGPPAPVSTDQRSSRAIQVSRPLTAAYLHVRKSQGLFFERRYRPFCQSPMPGHAVPVIAFQATLPLTGSHTAMTNRYADAQPGGTLSLTGRVVFNPFPPVWCFTSDFLPFSFTCRGADQSQSVLRVEPS